MEDSRNATLSRDERCVLEWYRRMDLADRVFFWSLVRSNNYPVLFTVFDRLLNSEANQITPVASAIEIDDLKLVGL